MKTYSSILMLVFISCINISCEKLLEVNLPSNQISSEKVFEDVQTANAALAGLYAGVRDNSPIAGDQAGLNFGVYTDDLDSYTVNVANNMYDLYANKQTDKNQIIYPYWSGAYEQIYRANSIIERANNSLTLPVNEKERIKGEALLVRSLIYFYLQQTFGDIPYITLTDYRINQSLSKTPKEEVLSKLENDVKEAKDLLSDAYRDPERIFPNRKVAELMLAKIYMTKQEWINAEPILKSIAQSSLYQFQTDITKVFNKNGSHILWQLKPNQPGDRTKESLTYYFIGAAPDRIALSQNLVNSFSSADLRKQYWMATVTVDENTWYRANKYKNITDNATEYSIVFRLEEVYLLLAEAFTQQGKVLEALPYVNATRARAGLIALSGQISQSSLLNEILLEDRREFFTEMGHRFLDLKRMNQLNTLVSVKPNWKDFHSLWPIPQQEILLNANLKPQNTGY